MSSSKTTKEPVYEREDFIDPNETYEEYTDEHRSDDHPMSEEDGEEMGESVEDEEMDEEEVIVDDSIQGFFLHTSSIYSVAIWEHFAATGGGDDLGYVWDITNGEMIMKLDGHKDSVTNVAFSVDGTYLATGGMDGQVRIWNVQERKLVVALEGSNEVLVCSPFVRF